MTPLTLFSQVFILKMVKALCFDTLLQVFILWVLRLKLEYGYRSLREGRMAVSRRLFVAFEIVLLHIAGE